jgi:hypothetical protein
VSEYVPEHAMGGPTVVERDARNRAWRTLWQGLFTDVAVSVLTVAVTVMVDIEWTREWWLITGGLLAKTVIMSAVSYVARRVVPPQNG